MARTGLALAAILLASAAFAQVTWTSEGRIETTVRPPPAHFEEGQGAQHRRHVKDLVLSPNATSFAAEVQGRAGADLRVREVVRLVNPTGSPQRVTVVGSAVPDSRVEAFDWTVRDGATQVAVLDHKQAEPSVLLTIPPQAALALDLRLDLADGAGGDAATRFHLGLRVAP